MKKLYKEQKHSLYEISKKTGLNKYTLYKYLKAGSKIKNMRTDTLYKIAFVEGIDPYELLKKMENYQNNMK